MIALALIFATSFEAAGEHRIEILTETHTIVAEACNPQYLVGMSGGGVLVGSCSTVEIRTRATTGGTSGGDFIVQVQPDLHLQDCLMTQVRRSLLPKPQTLMSFECKTQAD